jgi:Fe-S cluster assembly protein SufD
MAHVAERHASFVSAFEAFKTHPSFGSGATARAREAAYQRFEERGLPTTRDEDWRFTNVAPVAQTKFVHAGPTLVPSDAIAPYLIDGLHTVVVINGRLSTSLSSPKSTSGVDFRSESIEKVGNRLPESAFADLNIAFHEETIALEIPARTVVEQALHVLFVTVASHDAPIVAPRLVIRAGENSECTVIESYASLGAHASLTTAITEIELAANAVVDHVKIQRESAAAFHIANTAVRLDRSSTFASRSLTFGGRITRNDISAVLDGDGGECTLNGLYVAGGESLVDNHTTIDHAKPNCPSHEVYKGILSGRAKAVFNGRIIVELDAQKTNAKQTNKALLLSDDAQINTKPQLEIFADDVKCTHGAAIGQLDEDAMFYLRARGIGETEARAMLIHAFAGQVLDEIKNDAVRASVQKVLDDALHIG